MNEKRSDGKTHGGFTVKSSLDARNRTTVPAAIRAAMKAKPGTPLTWTVLSDGTVVVRAKSRSLTELAGMIKPPKGGTVTIDEMNPWR